VRTARMNVERRGIVQGYTVLTAESVTEDHPARKWVTQRFSVLRREIADAIQEIAEQPVSDEQALRAANAIIGVMDGLQVQWLLDGSVDLAESTTFAIEAILAAVLHPAEITHLPS
jgi:hypothetical protein